MPPTKVPHPLYALVASSVPNRILGLNRSTVASILDPNVLHELCTTLECGIENGRVIRLSTPEDRADAIRARSEVSALCALIARLAYRPEGVRFMGMHFLCIPGLWSRAVIQNTPAEFPEPTGDDIQTEIIKPVRLICERAGVKAEPSP